MRCIPRSMRSPAGHCLSGPFSGPFFGTLFWLLGADKKYSSAAAVRSRTNCQTGFRHLGGHKAAPQTPGRVQNGIQNRPLVETGNIIKIVGRLIRKPYF